MRKTTNGTAARPAPVTKLPQLDLVELQRRARVLQSKVNTALIANKEAELEQAKTQKWIGETLERLGLPQNWSIDSETGICAPSRNGQS